jgi:catechol 2,3-dioxygenase-like lactoylglutathione lyase family enzyme
MIIQMGTPIPVLRIFDEAKAREFYCGFLGFTVDWEHRFEPTFPLYLQVSSGACVLHLSEHYGDASPGALVRIPVDDIEGYIEGLNAQRYKFARPGINDQPWGRECAIGDPFHNRLVFHSPPSPTG